MLVMVCEVCEVEEEFYEEIDGERVVLFVRWVVVGGGGRSGM